MEADREQRRLELFGVLAVLALALCLRARHLETLLPWFIFEDETRTTGVTLHLITDRTLDPSHNLYPALAFYLNAAAFLAWAAVGMIGEIVRQGPHVLSEYFAGFSPDDPMMIMLSRWVSLVFGMGSLVFTHLLARQYLPWRWALMCTLLLAVNSMHISMSVLAKVDAINLFWISAGYYTMVMYLRVRGRRWLIMNAICTGFSVVTKNNYQLVVTSTIFIALTVVKERGGITAMLKAQLEILKALPGALFNRRRLRPLLRSRDLDLWIGLLVMAAAAFIGSPYTFIRLPETMVNVGWLYRQSEIISTYHTDPHHWWLDRYFYLFSVVFPFIFGLLFFAVMIPALVHHVRKHALRNPYIQWNLIWFTYIFASQSGGPRGGSFPYYLFLNVVPLVIIITMEWLYDLTRSSRIKIRALGLILGLALLAISLARVDSFKTMFYGEYDQLGPWLASELKPNERALIISVYKPAPALGQKKIFFLWPAHRLGAASSLIFDDPRDRILSVWPQSLKLGDHDLIELFDPEYVVVDTWLMGGFKKIYREHWAAPLVDSLTEKRGYRVVKRFPARYFGRAYFAAIDPEHDVELIVLKKTGLADD